MGALLLRPRLVRSFAAAHPPAWFVDAAALEIMRGLFCTATGRCKATVEDVIDTLDRHDTLALAGGSDAIRALAAPRPELDLALRKLDELLDRLPRAEREQVTRAEDLDDLEALIENGLDPWSRATGIGAKNDREPAARLAVPDEHCGLGLVDAEEQLPLFHDRPRRGEADHA